MAPSARTLCNTGTMLRSLRKVAENLERSVDIAFSSQDTDPGGYQGREFVLGAQKVRLGHVFAEGGFSFVHSAKPVRGPSNVRYAVKRMAVVEKEAIERARRELDILSSIPAHPKLVRFYGGIVEPPHALLMFEMVDGGTLPSILNRKGGRAENGEEALAILDDAVSAVVHLHSQSPPVACRDIKLENLLYDRLEKTYKLCDLGSCTTEVKKYVTRAEILKAEDEISEHSTMMYRAPEMVDLYQKQLVTERVDVWALGCVWYALLFGNLPFDGSSSMPILKGSYTIPDSPAYPPAFIELLKSMLTVDPAKRPDSFALLDVVRRLRGRSMDPALREKGAQLRQQRARDFANADDHRGQAESMKQTSATPVNLLGDALTMHPSTAATRQPPHAPSRVSLARAPLQASTNFAQDIFAQANATANTTDAHATEQNTTKEGGGWADFESAFGAPGIRPPAPASSVHTTNATGNGLAPAQSPQMETFANFSDAFDTEPPAHLQVNRSIPLSANLGALYNSSSTQPKQGWTANANGFRSAGTQADKPNGAQEQPTPPYGVSAASGPLDLRSLYVSEPAVKTGVQNTYSAKSGPLHGSRAQTRKAASASNDFDDLNDLVAGAFQMRKG